MKPLILGLILLSSPAWGWMEWPSIGSETQTQQREIDATRRRQTRDELDQAQRMRDLQDQVDELRTQQRRLQQRDDD
jgi:hypothetical protein